MSWRALHIYYFDQQDKILKDDLKLVMEKNKIKDFFFIRYWENGPHIRLRLKDLDDIQLFSVKEDISNLIMKKKSKEKIDKNEYKKIAAELAKREGMQLDSYNIEDNNTIKECEYIPELKKYNGRDGVTIAEREFIHSSRIALDVIQLNLKQSMKYIFGALYAIDVCLALSSDKNKGFFEQYVKYWAGFGKNSSESAVEKFRKRISGINLDEAVLLYIKRYYDEQKNYVFHKKIFQDLKKIAGEKDVLRFGFNFVHLFNNRIGIIPAEEVMIGIMALSIMEKSHVKEVYN